MEYILAIVLLASVWVQGGFFPTVFLGAAVVLALLALFCRNRRLDWCDGTIWLLAGLFLAASLVRGYSSQSLSQACLPGVWAIFLYVYRALPKEKKDGMLRSVLLGSGVFAGAAILAFCGVFPLEGAVSSHRLQFSFQYANAAGSWFAAAALLSQDGKRNPRFLMPILAALFLTRSMGALGLYGVVQLARIWQCRKKGIWRGLVLSHVAAACFAAGFFFLDGWLAVCLLALLYTGGYYQERLFLMAQRVYLHWFALLAGGIGGVILLFSQRFHSSLQSLAERLVQILDALRIMAEHPLLGIGAGNWERWYPYYQSAQYTSTVVHSGIAQMGVDAGVFAVATAGVFVFFAWKRKSGSRAAAAFLILHSLLDFTMQFLPIGLLLMALLFSEEAPLLSTKRSRALPFAMGLLCAGCLCSQVAYKQLVYHMQHGAWAAVTEQYEQQRFLLGSNPMAHGVYLHGLYAQGDLRKILDTVDGEEPLRLEEIVLRAYAVREIEGEDAACQVLLEELERRIYQVNLFEQTAALFQEWQVNTRWQDAYNQLADRANRGKTILGTLKGDQVHIEHININLGGSCQ